MNSNQQQQHKPVASCFMCTRLCFQEDMMKGVVAKCQCVGWLCKNRRCLEQCVEERCHSCYVELEQESNDPPPSDAELARYAAAGEPFPWG
jgi:hypothetical protein